MSYLVALVLAVSFQSEDVRFGDCEAALQRAVHPTDDQAYMCVYRTAQRTRAWTEAEDYLRAWMGRLPEDHAWQPWLQLVLGHVRARESSEDGRAAYLAAAERFSSLGEAKGEVLARSNRSRLFRRAGLIEEARREVDLGVEAAERADDPVALTRAVLARSNLQIAIGSDLAEAMRSLQRVEDYVSTSGDRGMRSSFLGVMGRAAITLGRTDEAIDAWRQLLEMYHETDNTFGAASISFNIANARATELVASPTPGGRREALALALDALALATESGNARSEAFSRRLVAELLPSTAEGTLEAVEHLDRCFELSRELSLTERRTECLWTLASRLATTDPAASRRYAEEAVALALKSGTPPSVAYAWRERAATSWRTKPFDEAVRDAQDAITAVESLRRLQEADGERAELFANWTRDYYELSGRLLRHGRVADAFGVVERMRSRVLMESIEAAGALDALPRSHPLLQERRELLHAIAAVQRELLAPGLSESIRREAIARLETLEADERALQARLRRELSGFALREPEFASLDDVQAELDDNEALLSFQVGLERDIYDEDAGGSWLTLITNADTHAIGIPDRVALEPIVPVYLGLIGRRDTTASDASVRLHRDLLATALSRVSPSVDRLIVVPDGALGRLPFDTLRASAGEGPLGRRFEISATPSATLWLRWRRGEVPRREASVLALADPTVGPAVSSERSAVLREGLELGALPYARKEGRSILRHLGAGELLVADEASEHALKNEPLDRYGILHFAAHAVTDEENPDRSAIVLSPGAATEDGLLQIREIRELDLDGKLVVLSACSSATGRNLSGEGMLSLARAFFQAGAHAVIGSQWLLRDDEAAYLFDRFYRALAEGQHVSAALASAKREAMDDGLPESAWSGLVLYGNGALRPVHDARRKRSGAIVALILLVLVPVLVLAHRKFRATRLNAPAG